MKLLRVLATVLVIGFSSAALAADLAVTAGNVLPSSRANAKSAAAGETITAGQTVYIRASDHKFYKADANVATNGEYKVDGIAVNGASTGQLVRAVYADGSFKPGATITVGTTYCQSATAGAIAPCADVIGVSGNYNSFLGIGVSTTSINLKIVRSDTVVP